MLIECPFCKSRVDAKVHGERQYSSPPEEDDPTPFKVTVAECSNCHFTLVGLQHEVDHPVYGYVWSEAVRLWPQAKRMIDWTIPEIVRTSLEEGDRCYHAGAYSACAVMCGRALEGMCVHHNTKSKVLFDGLKELKDKEVIDKRLLSWADELRKVRNLGAHATTARVSQQDARDVLDFAHAITDYVFVLNEQFDRFMSRRSPANPAERDAAADSPRE